MADTALPPLVDDLRCAPQAVDLGLDPRGTATQCTTLVLVEHGGAWPARIEDLDVIAELAPLGPDHRVLITRGHEDAPPGSGRAPVPPMPSLTIWRAGDDLRWSGADYDVAPGSLPGAIAALAQGLSPADAAGVAEIGPAPPEVLVCGHGRRDTCCGRFGIRLLQEVDDGPSDRWPGVRVRRCSHTGGHRFAPTGITLPDGRMWAFLDLDLLDAAVTGRLHPGLADANRGLMTLDPMAQVAEAAAWDEIGPAWQSVAPRVERLYDDHGAGEGAGAGGSDGESAPARYRIDAGATTVEVSVRRSGAATVPACGVPIDEATKTSPIYEVLSVSVA